MFDPRTGDRLAYWQMSRGILYRGLAVRAVAAAPAVPAMTPWGNLLLALAVGGAAIAIIRRVA